MRNFNGMIWGLVFSIGGVLSADDCSSTYRLMYRTEYEEQEVTAYRLEYHTEMRESQVTTTRPVWETEQRVRRYTVARPVTETQTREERYSVMRPVWETETRQEQHTVRRAVTDTVMQDRNYVTYDPVTTMRTEYVDQGSFVDQTYYSPGPNRNRLSLLGGGYAADPVTGALAWRPAGFYWVPVQLPGTYSVARQYVPNVVAQQVPQTNYVARVVTEKVPTTVTRYVDEVVCKPVEVKVCKWVQQEVVRPIQVSTQRIEYEEREEPVQVRVCRMVTETKAVQTPHTVGSWVRYVTTQMVPKTVAIKVPVAECNSCGATAYYPPATSLSLPPSAPITTRKVPAPAKTEVKKAPTGSSVLKDKEEAKAAETQKAEDAKKVETPTEATKEPPTPEKVTGVPEKRSDLIEVAPAEPEPTEAKKDATDTGKPALNSANGKTTT